jgi:hypothetical protein
MYTLSDHEWSALALLAECATEAIPDLQYDSLSTPDPHDPPQSTVVRAVVYSIQMIAGPKPAFMEGELRAVLQPLMQVAREELEDSPCDHSVGICNCALGLAVARMNHVFYHLDHTLHSHCEKCGAPVLGVQDFAMCWHCADAEKYPQG